MTHLLFAFMILIIWEFYIKKSIGFNSKPLKFKKQDDEVRRLVKTISQDIDIWHITETNSLKTFTVLPFSLLNKYTTRGVKLKEGNYILDLNDKDVWNLAIKELKLLADEKISHRNHKKRVKEETIKNALAGITEKVI